MSQAQQSRISGWREWLSLPELNIRAIEAKIDTGTRTSVLHTSFIEPYRKQGNLWVRFGVHPLPEDTNHRLVCLAPVKDKQFVNDCEGHEEVRFVIETPISLGDLQTTIKVTLTNHDANKFRMLLGRTALQDLQLMIDPNQTHLFGDRKVVKTEAELEKTAS